MEGMAHGKNPEVRESEVYWRLKEAWPVWHFCLGRWHRMRLESQAGSARLLGYVKDVDLDHKSNEALPNNS